MTLALLSVFSCPLLGPSLPSHWRKWHRVMAEVPEATEEYQKECQAGVMAFVVYSSCDGSVVEIFYLWSMPGSRMTYTDQQHKEKWQEAF